jgi:5-methylcytosine-specific restriction protein A
MVVDAEHPYTERWDYDKQNNLRKVYVFRLRPADVDLTDIRPGDVVQPAQQTVVLPVPVPKPKEPVEPGARSRKTERHRTGQTVAKVAAGERVVNRREGILFTAFEEHLEAAGHAFNTFQISVKGEPTRLTPDLYDETDHALYEGKGLTTRSNVRMAMGQLLDYRRYIDNADTLRLVVLLPSEPTPDVKDLLQTEGFHLVFQTEESFTGFPLS